MADYDLPLDQWVGGQDMFCMQCGGMSGLTGAYCKATGYKGPHDFQTRAVYAAQKAQATAPVPQVAKPTSQSITPVIPQKTYVAKVGNFTSHEPPSTVPWSVPNVPGAWPAYTWHSLVSSIYHTIRSRVPGTKFDLAAIRKWYEYVGFETDRTTDDGKCPNKEVYGRVYSTAMEHRLSDLNNLGVYTGKGFWVLDIDNGQDLSFWNGVLPQTLTAKTCKGYHMYWKLPDGAIPPPNSVKQLRPNTDVRGHDGFIVVPPSRFVDGSGYYEFVTGVDEPIEAPPWLYQAACQCVESKNYAQAQAGAVSITTSSSVPFTAGAPVYVNGQQIGNVTPSVPSGRVSTTPNGGLLFPTTKPGTGGIIF